MKLICKSCHNPYKLPKGIQKRINYDSNFLWDCKVCGERNTFTKKRSLLLIMWLELIVIIKMPFLLIARKIRSIINWWRCPILIDFRKMEFPHMDQVGVKFLDEMIDKRNNDLESTVFDLSSTVNKLEKEQRYRENTDLVVIVMLIVFWFVFMDIGSILILTIYCIYTLINWRKYSKIRQSFFADMFYKLSTLNMIHTLGIQELGYKYRHGLVDKDGNKVEKSNA